MEANKIKINSRLYHALFGWCKVISPVDGDKVLVDLEADSITYYVHGKGYKTITRKENNTNVIQTPIEELSLDENISLDMYIKRLAFSPKITLPKKCTCDNDECESNLISGRNCKNCINKL